ncbi:hypothetical protein [Actinoplanes flavus]|uniref:Esterase n=1 Tax=Actinoplanes flavus TaxID=2820290 RepID=A0ABS3UTJ3_9ACTN|nr:hypothetical protein [Actinoplanes flavus]MBO3741877.1 hypothetical protein [Actinoplanes flavus]
MFGGSGGGPHARWLLESIPGARAHRYTGGHVPGPEIFRQIYDWLRAPAG